MKIFDNNFKNWFAEKVRKQLNEPKNDSVELQKADIKSTKTEIETSAKLKGIITSQTITSNGNKIHNIIKTIDENNDGFFIFAKELTLVSNVPCPLKLNSEVEITISW